MLRSALLLLFAGTLCSVQGAFNVLDYGLVHNDTNTDIAFANAKAFLDAVVAANASETDREVYLPRSDDHKVYYMMPMHMEYLDNITFTIDGTIMLSEDNKRWPNKTQKDSYHFWELQDSNNVVIRGSGHIEGNGYWWWMREYIVANKFKRPHIFQIDRCHNLTIEGIKLTNSPRYHISLDDVVDVLIQNITIKVNVEEQKKLAKKYGHFDFKLSLPTFPLNTDGIDPSGVNITIRNSFITSYDDSVAVKPGNYRGKYTNCAENILVENVTTWEGVGMTIGTVPPKTYHNCIRNVTFRNIIQHAPFKAIYIKTNPGVEGDGIIENILYENLTINDPIWWAIYIGPQQQKQPDGAGPGCMLYPIIKECATEPRVTIRNITLRNVHSRGGLLPPGIIRCNETNPCRDFTFENVNFHGWLLERHHGYITENVFGTAINSSPDPKFNHEMNQEDLKCFTKAYKEFLFNPEYQFEDTI